MTPFAGGQSTTVRANGLRHRVLQFGHPSAPDLLILPGITMPAAGVAFLARPLADVFHVHVPDLRGRGQSDRATGGAYRLEDYADDVDGIITGLDLDVAVLLGHSLGARIAAAYVARHGRSHVGQVVLVDPPVTGPGRPPYPTPRASFERQLAEARRGTTPEELRAYYPRWPLPELELRARILPTCDEQAVLETYDRFATEDFLALWEQLDVPTLLVRGGDSPVVTAEDARELQRRNPQVPQLTVPDAGHMVPWDNLPGFLNAIDEHVTQPARSQ